MIDERGTEPDSLSLPEQPRLFKQKSFFKEQGDRQEKGLLAGFRLQRLFRSGVSSEATPEGDLSSDHGRRLGQGVRRGGVA